MFQVKQITVEELNNRIENREAFKLVDVREKDEYDICQIQGSTLIPLSEFQNKAMQELKPEDDLVIHCHHGGRSQRACEYLMSLGFKKVVNLAGGIDAWSQKVDPKVPRY